MAIQEEMYKQIEHEINNASVEESKVIIDLNKTKEVAKMLTDLSVDSNDSETLVNQYIANIKNICK